MLFLPFFLFYLFICILSFLTYYIYLQGEITFRLGSAGPRLFFSSDGGRIWPSLPCPSCCSAASRGQSRDEHRIACSLLPAGRRIATADSLPPLCCPCVLFRALGDRCSFAWSLASTPRRPSPIRHLGVARWGHVSFFLHWSWCPFSYFMLILKMFLKNYWQMYIKQF